MLDTTMTPPSPSVECPVVDAPITFDWTVHGDTAAWMDLRPLPWAGDIKPSLSTVRAASDDDDDDEFDEFDDIDEEDFDDDFDDDFEEELEDDYEIEIEDEISTEFGLNSPKEVKEDDPIDDGLDDFEDFENV